VAFESDDGVTLAGIRRPVDGKPKAGIVLAHGILTDKDYGEFYPALARELAGHGFESLRFDFRGHGESEGELEEMTIAGEVRDLDAAVRLLRSRRNLPVGIVGTSFGAGVAVLYAAQARRLPFALVLLSSILDYRRGFLEPETPWAKKWFTPSALEEAYARGALAVGGARLGIELIREFEAERPEEMLRNLAIPVLMVHGERDPIASFLAARDAARSSPHVRFVGVGEGEHYFEGAEARVFREISEWLEGQAPAY
jgi:pimeloyl-ACP methyl ester carboxylesterase